MDPAGRQGAAHPQRGPGARARAAARGAPRAARARRAASSIRVQEAAPLGQAGDRGRRTPSARLRRPRRHRGFLGAHHARRPHRHHRPERLRQDHADQAAARRIGAHRGRDPPRHRACSSPTSTSSASSWTPTASIMDNVTGGSGDTVTINGQPRHVSGYLQDFLFPPERCTRPVRMLSGGERNRLLLARLFAQPTNLLVLDEPTNDLDVETLELLEELLAELRGHAAAGQPRPGLSRQRGHQHAGVRGRRARQRICRRLQRLAAPAQSSARSARAAARRGSAGAAAPRRPPNPRRGACPTRSSASSPAMPEKIQRLEAEQTAAAGGDRRSRAVPQWPRRVPTAALQPLAGAGGGTRDCVRALGCARVLEGARPVLAARFNCAGVHDRADRWDSAAPAGGVGDDQRRCLFAAHFLQFTHGLLNGRFGGRAEFFDRRVQRGGVELEADRHGAHRRHDLRLSDEYHRPRGIR